MFTEDILIRHAIKVRELKTSAYKTPTATPESDGTIKWVDTTLVLVELYAGGKTGIGYTYANIAAASVIDSVLSDVVVGMNCMNIPAINAKMISQIRNDGNTGIAMMAVAAVDNALWDLKAKLFDVPLCMLLGMATDKMKIYGSGGFTSYNKKQLQEQLSHWVQIGIRSVKIKIGREPAADIERIAQAREAIGDSVNLFVDANGAYSIKQALEKAAQFTNYDISWFEEPVSSDNLEGLHFIRDHIQPPVQVAAGEYGFNLHYFKKMLDAKAVDVLQADATRCGGISGFLKAGHLAQAYMLPFSSHCAPAMHLHAALSLQGFYIAEYFYDHARIESMLFEGLLPPEDGYMKPDLTAPGIGLQFRHADAKKYKL